MSLPLASRILMRPGLLDDELAIVPGRGNHDQRMGEPLGHYLELHVQSRGGQRRTGPWPPAAASIRQLFFDTFSSLLGIKFGPGRTSDSLALGANRSRERAPRRRRATAKSSEYRRGQTRRDRGKMPDAVHAIAGIFSRDGSVEYHRMTDESAAVPRPPREISARGHVIPGGTS